MFKFANLLGFILFFFLPFQSVLIAQNDRQAFAIGENYPNIEIKQQVSITNRVKIQVSASMNYPIGQEYHWAVRIAISGSQTEGNLIKKQGLIKLSNPSSLVFQDSFQLDPQANVKVYAYLLDREFVVAQDDSELQQDTVTLSANENQAPKPKPFTTHLAPDGFDLGGLVFNETRTRTGREFFSIFQQNWKPPTQTEAYWITIKEYPTPGRFTLISVSLNNRELFQRFLQPRKEYLESLVVLTVQTLTELLSLGEIEGLFSEQDLHGAGVEVTETEEY
jgi:hypothetical protein